MLIDQTVISFFYPFDSAIVTTSDLISNRSEKRIEEKKQMIGEKVAFWEREIPLWTIQKTFYWKRLLWYETTDEIYLLASVWYGHSLQTDEPIIHLKRS